MQITIRQENLSDYDRVLEITNEAFKGLPFSDENESELIRRLRVSPEYIPELSLVAEYENQVVGHILFTPISIESRNKSFPTLSLAPISILPKFQQLGIGSMLINKGHELAKQMGFNSVIVLGHPEYYPRFGYKPISNWPIKSPFDVPDDYFMALELVPGALNRTSGIVCYPAAFQV